ncbi:acyl-CoA thioesterase 9-like protein [Aphelenchoides avenae]|nr:acyl-CoA thioesterase 9-like protein [Aphelenchus avenae]
MLNGRRAASSSSFQTIQHVREALKNHVDAMDVAELSPYDPNRAHPMSISEDTAVIPLGSRPEIRLQYINHEDLMRFGMILEDLDTFAVWLAYKHNQGGAPLGTPSHHPMCIVTACVDRIDMQNTTIRADQDIIMQGHVSWVGRSSIESTMHLKQKTDGNEYRDVLTARFVMVALDLVNKKSIPNVKLKPETEAEKERFAKGEFAKNARMAREEHSLLKNPPTEIERTILHDIFLKTIENPCFRGVHKRVLPPNHIWMRDAKLKNTVICFPVKRNLYGKIFRWLPNATGLRDRMG